MRIDRKTLHDLIAKKMHKAGLSKEHADIAADALAFADARGIHSHGAVRVEYYSERIAKGGMTHNPQITYTETGPSSAILDFDNGCGLVAAKMGMDKAIEMAKKNGVAVVGIKRMSHSGSLCYFTEMAAEQDLVAISMCQSDPMAVPFGGAQAFFGTNPIAFAAPTADERIVSFDMATTVQAWGKVLYARSKGEPIPPTWAVDENGEPTTDSHKVNALVPIAGAKGYGLMMMVDILSGILLGLPFGKNVSSMYADLSKGRDLGHLHIVINPEYFIGLDTFKKTMSAILDQLKQVKPAKGNSEVYFPGERGKKREADYQKNGIEIVDDIYQYLISDDIHYNRYDHKNKFAE